MLRWDSLKNLGAVDGMAGVRGVASIEKDIEWLCSSIAYGYGFNSEISKTSALYRFHFYVTIMTVYDLYCSAT